MQDEYEVKEKGISIPDPGMCASDSQKGPGMIATDFFEMESGRNAKAQLRQMKNGQSGKIKTNTASKI